MNTRTSAFFALSLLAAASAAADPPADPEVARLNAEAARLTAETALLTAQTANAAAKYGPVPAGKEGTITNPEKFLAMGQWTLSAATAEVAQNVLTQLPGLSACPGDLFVTSTEDRRAAAIGARTIGRKLESFTEVLEEKDASVRTSRLALLPALNAVRGVVGSLDSLVGLFRADYAFADAGATASDSSLRLAVAHALETRGSRPPGARVFVDGFAEPAVDRKSVPALMSQYERFDTARRAATVRYLRDTAAAKTDAEKAKLAADKAILDAANAFDTALTTPVGGQVPLVGAALADIDLEVGTCVVYVKFGSYASSLVTRKKLLSRNDEVVALAGGSVQIALFDDKGAPLDYAVMKVDKRHGAKLSDLVASARSGESTVHEPVTPR